MSTQVVRSEIERFLSSPLPEVLCVSGRWGVGKTFVWQKFLRVAEAENRLAKPRYAYVSLFGLNSLGELRNAIVENTIVAEGPLTSPDAQTLNKLLREGEKYVRQSRPALEIAAGFFRLKDAGDALYRAAFLTVRDQLICFDDLERAGEGLRIKDVLGIASMLREQRGCKIALLLNKEKTESDQAKDFNSQLEKVIDTFLVFEPTSAEAVSIAVEGLDPVADILRERIQVLGITNIRVIKKIERWARQVERLLDGHDQTLVERAITVTALAGWSFLQPEDAPPHEFLISYAAMSGLFGIEKDTDEQKRWRSFLREYGFVSMSELDREILIGVAVGYFREAEMRLAAEQMAARAQQSNSDNSYSRAWDMYHRDFSADDEAILDAIHAGAVENLVNISPASINGTVRFLRQYGREKQASELVDGYVRANSTDPKFFSNRNMHFFDEQIDPQLFAELEAGRAAIVDTRDPAEMLKRMAETKGFNPEEDVARFSKLTPDEIVELFDNNAGENLKGMVEWANILASQQGADKLRANMTSALEQIASRSPMRADRLRSWGFLSQKIG